MSERGAHAGWYCDDCGGDANSVGHQAHVAAELARELGEQHIKALQAIEVALNRIAGAILHVGAIQRDNPGDGLSSTDTPPEER